jgi:hypothetical protein
MYKSELSPSSAFNATKPTLSERGRGEPTLGKLIPQREIAAAMPPNANMRRALAPLDMTSVAEWLVERGLRGLLLDDQVDGFCRRVVDAGFPARRFNMSIGTAPTAWCA